MMRQGDATNGIRNGSGDEDFMMASESKSGMNINDELITPDDGFTTFTCVKVVKYNAATSASKLSQQTSPSTSQQSQTECQFKRTPISLPFFKTNLTTTFIIKSKSESFQNSMVDLHLHVPKDNSDIDFKTLVIEVFFMDSKSPAPKWYRVGGGLLAEDDGEYVLKDLCSATQLPTFLNRKAYFSIRAKLIFHFYGRECAKYVTHPTFAPTNTTSIVPSVLFFKSKTDHEDILKKIYDDKIHSDVVLRVENRSFACHKAFLAAHSDVFERMFSLPMTENRDGEVYINDFSAEIVENLLKYIYYQDISSWTEDMNMAVNMLEIGLKYNIQKLYSECDKVIRCCDKKDGGLFEGITGLRLFILANDLPQYEHLKVLAVAIMKANAEETVNSDEFDALLDRSRVLAKQIMIAIAKALD